MILAPDAGSKKLHMELGLGITSEAFDQLAAENLSVLQQTFLWDTVSNAGLEEEELRAMASHLQIPCEQKYFAVCMLSIRSDATAVGREVLHLLIRDTVSASIQESGGKTVFFTDPDGMLNCILNSFVPDPKKKLEAAVAEARLRLRGMADVHLFFAVGPTVNSLSRLYASRTAAWDMLLYNQAIISSGERVFESGVTGKYTYSVLEQLMSRFRENDAVGVNRILQIHLHQLQSDEGLDQKLCEGFLLSFLKRITCECIQNGIAVDRFENYVPAVLSLMQSDIPGTTEAVVKLVEQILNHISHHGTTESNYLLSMAKEYVRDHIADERLNLEAVSNHVGLSRVYFCKLFHQMEGISFSAYLKTIRIEKAKQLLMTTNLKIFEVSNAVGFSHAKYFGQVFKQEVGQTPVEFQKHIQLNR
jgi:two-component system response regulator YesN